MAVALGITAALGCASGQPPTPVSGTVAVGAEDTLGVEQSLYRLTFDRGGGRTSLKVVLRRSLGRRFQVVFSDVAGRRVWSLDHSPQRAILVDHRAGTYCISGPGLSLPEVHPRELPLAAIPKVLAGELPIAENLVAGSDEFVDESGRRWRVSHSEGELVAWSLLDDAGPALWWARDREGGILSRRGGEQYRWKLVVTEASSDPLREIVPAGFAEGTCSE